MATPERTTAGRGPRRPVPRGPSRGPAPRDPAGRPALQHEVAGAAGLNLLAGIWLIISPWVLGYTSDDATWNPVVFGAIVAVLALVRLAGAYRASWLSWINAAIGVWLFVSAYWLADSATASWNVGVLGVIVFVLGVIGATALRSALRRPHERRWLR